MFKKIGTVLIIMVFLLAAIGVVMADDKGNKRKGKYLFRKNCRTCHVDGGDAKELSPISKTQADWQKAFDNFKQLQCVATWDKLSDKDRADMFAYLHGHAFDSPSPAKCK
ncbi:MAG: cytochrome c [Desulfobacterales bacterium]|jgi:mono/diheme cytochrome c family protein